MDEQTKQVITNAMKQLSNEDPSIRIDGVRKLGEIGVDHPKIIERLESLASEDSSPDVRNAANNSLTLFQGFSIDDEIKNSQVTKESTLVDIGNESTTIELLQEQNKLLKSLRKIVLRGTDIVEEDEIYTTTTITDVNIPISSLTKLMLKWVIASIPVVILIWGIVAILSILLGGLLFKGF